MRYVVWAKSGVRHSFTIYVKSIPQESDAEIKLNRGKLSIKHNNDFIIQRIKKDLATQGVRTESSYSEQTLISTLCLSTLPVSWSGKFKDLNNSNNQSTNEYNEPKHYNSYSVSSDEAMKQIYQQSRSLDVSSIPFIHSTENLEVIVDSREPTLIKDYLSISPIRDFRVDTLEVGDILIRHKITNDTLIIERKTIQDLANSVKSHHMHSQAERIYDVKNDLISSGVRCRAMWFIESQEDKGMFLYNSLEHVKQVDGVVNYLSGILDEHVIHTHSPLHTAYLAIKMSQGFFEQQLKYSVNTARTKSKRQKQAITADKNTDHGVALSSRADSGLLVQIPGINKKVAKELSDRNITIADLCVMSEKDLCSIEGIGNKSAEKIRRALHGE